MIELRNAGSRRAAALSCIVPSRRAPASDSIIGCATSEALSIIIIYSEFATSKLVSFLKHWHRLVKNTGWANRSFGGNVAKTDKCMCISQILGARPVCPPSLRLCS